MILWISDDLNLSDLLIASLRQAGVETAGMTPDQALESWADSFPDAMLCDIYSPDFNAVDLIRQLRAESAAPILLLTPITAEPHTLEVYQAGADEVVVKPVGSMLLLAKIRAWLRYSGMVRAQSLPQIEAGGLRLDPLRREVSKPEGEIVRLTQLEFRLLHYLMRRPGLELPAEEIVASIYQCEGDATLLKHLIYRLRRKIEPDPAQPRHIQTTPGGYIFTL